MTKTLEAALEYADRGWSVIPIRGGTKLPAISWKEYQLRHPTEDEIYKWFENTNNDIAIICGTISKLIVVDTDDAEATKLAAKNGWDKTPYRVKTRKGFHFYFSTEHKVRKGKLAEKIDLQAEASYVLAPPSKDKIFSPLEGCDAEDLPAYPGPKIGDNVIPLHSHNSYDEINLEIISTKQNAWQEAEQFTQRNGRKLTAGDTCHNRIVSWIGHLISQELSGEEIYKEAINFCNTFMDDPFDDKKIMGVIRDLARKEQVETKFEEEKELKKKKTFEPITTASIDALAKIIGEQTFYVDPIIPSNDASLTMIFGYSGHGKSMFTRNMLYAACVGKMNYGPFILSDKPRVLYLDLEKGKRNVLKFLTQAKKTYGDAGENFMMYAPFQHEDMNLKSEGGIAVLQSIINKTRPNVVCIDTVRTAFVGMAENEGKEWSDINQLILKLRNSGISVVLVHHANKPQGDGASGSYAGSTNALTNLEFGIKITQVFDEADRARTKAGLYSGDIENPLLHRLDQPAALRHGEKMAVKMEVRFVKNREADESLEDLSYVGFASNYESGTFRCVSTKTTKQRAMELSRPHRDNTGVVIPPLSNSEISKILGIQQAVINDWIKPIVSESVENYIANVQ